MPNNDTQREKAKKTNLSKATIGEMNESEQTRDEQALRSLVYGCIQLSVGKLGVEFTLVRVNCVAYLVNAREANLSEIGFSDFIIIFENYFLIDVFYFIFVPSKYLHTFEIIFIKTVSLKLILP